MTIIDLSGRLKDLADLDAPVERVGGGYVFTEGPVWHARERHLTFSDIRTATMYRWPGDGEPRVFRQPSNEANGNTYDRQGRLITCEHQGRRVSRTDGSGRVETLVGDFEGKQHNSPNDVICLPNGDLIFTDPPYGLRQPDGSFLDSDYGFSGVFRWSAAGGSFRVLEDRLARPNGLVLTDDGSRLLLADTGEHKVYAYDVASDGSLSGRRVFAEAVRGETTGRPDGMKLDALGNLYVTGGTVEGVWVFSPEGEHLGFIAVGEPPANCAWGDDDWQTLYVTATTSVYRLRLNVSGQPVVIE